jgi:lactoylglutathione lyase
MNEPGIGAHAPQLLHAMIRVGDLDRALAFYCGLLGLREVRRIGVPEQGLTLVFLGYPDAPPNSMQIELWHEPSATGAQTEAGAHGGHVGIGVRRLADCVASLAAQGVPVRRAPGPMRPGGRLIALVEDPDGHEVELLATD